jgi:hypothetical protein
MTVAEAISKLEGAGYWVTINPDGERITCRLPPEYVKPIEAAQWIGVLRANKPDALLFLKLRARDITAIDMGSGGVEREAVFDADDRRAMCRWALAVREKVIGLRGKVLLHPARNKCKLRFVTLELPERLPETIDCAALEAYKRDYTRLLDLDRRIMSMPPETPENEAEALLRNRAAIHLAVDMAWTSFNEPGAPGIDDIMQQQEAMRA